MTIPAEIEKMILQGRAEFSAVTHNADQFIVDPPTDGYQIIFGLQFHYPSQNTQEKSANYSIIAAADNTVNFYQAKAQVFGQGGPEGSILNQTPQPTELILYTVTENPVYFSVIAQNTGVEFPTVDYTFSNTFLDALPVGYLPESFLGWGGVDYLLAYTAPITTPDFLYYLPFGQPFTNNNFPGELVNPEGLGFNSWFLHPKDLSNTAARIVPNTSRFFQTREWINVLGVTVYSVKVREAFPTRTKNKFVI